MRNENRISLGYNPDLVMFVVDFTCMLRDIHFYKNWRLHMEQITRFVSKFIFGLIVCGMADVRRPLLEGF